MRERARGLTGVLRLRNKVLRRRESEPLATNGERDRAGRLARELRKAGVLVRRATRRRQELGVGGGRDVDERRA
jgi:hypothetical protein